MNSKSIKNLIEKRKKPKVGMAETKIETTFKILEEYFRKEDYILNNLIQKSQIGFFGHSELYHIFEIFKEINLKKYWSFLDLGSGDGRIVFIASLFTKSIGFEINNELYKKSLNNKKKLEVSILNSTEFEECNYKNKIISNYDLVFLNPDKPFNMEKLEEYIHKNNTNYLIDITLFKPRFMSPSKEFSFENRKYGFYQKRSIVN